MANKTTFVKIDRNITRWGWYKDGNTMRVFLHLVLTANIRDCVFEGVTIHRGEVATSYSSISSALGLSIQNVRTAINHLKSTSEITSKQYTKFSVFTVLNYDMYQGKPTGKVTGDQQETNRRLTGDQQQSKNKRITNVKEKKESAAPAHPGCAACAETEWPELTPSDRRAVEIHGFQTYEELQRWKNQ